MIRVPAHGLLIATLSVALTGCAPRPRPLHVITWNIAHGRGTAALQIGLPRARFQENLLAIAETLRRAQPDVVALQEADAASSWSGRFSHVDWLAEAAGLGHVAHGLHADSDLLGLHYGTALLARSPWHEIHWHAFNSDRLDTKGYVLAQLELDGRPLLVVSVHLDFRGPPIRRKQALQLVGHLRDHALPMVVLGDFNCIWPAEDDALRMIAEQLDLRAFDAGAVDRRTFPSHAPHARLDWILISREFEFVTYGRLPEQFSDHLAVNAHIAWR